MSLRPQPKGLGSAKSQAAAPGPRLTRRECEVMHWVIEGKRDREIATILGISRRTVEKHVCHILEKLGVETRTAAANECIRLSRTSETSSPLATSSLPNLLARFNGDGLCHHRISDEK